MTEPTSHVLRGHHAVVTGGGRGLGATIAAALAAEGADITLMGRTAATIERHADTLRAVSSGRAYAVVCDVTDAASVQHAFADATRAFGPVRVLINNAGQADAALVQDIPIESWERMLAVNLTGTFLFIQ